MEKESRGFGGSPSGGRAFRFSPLIFSPLILGFTSIASQILLLREMVVVCYGNELSLGIMLSAWLLWVGMGSLLGGRWARRFPVAERSLSAGYLLVALALPVTLLLTRSSRALSGIGPGEIMALPTIILICLLLALPLCALLGFLFVLNARLSGHGQNAIDRAISSVYLWEAVGAFLGGILSPFLFLPHLSNLQLALLVALLNAALGICFLASTRAAALGAAATLAAGLAVSFLLHLPSSLDSLSWRWHWRDLNLRETKDTIYGNLVVGEHEGQISLYENGARLFSHPDPAAAEEAIHYALLQHPHPRSLFLLGGGVGGGLAQALKYPGLTIDYAELDPGVIDLSARYLPSEKEALQDGRVQVLHGDGRLLLQRSPRRYDVLIVNLPDPRTLQLNRFYTEEFFRLAKERLLAGGVFSFRASSSENYLSPDQAQYLALLRETLRAVFPEVVAFPGEMCLFFASLEQGYLLRDAAGLVQRLRERRLHNLFVSEELIPFRLHPFKMAYLEEQLNGQKSRINRDREPLCYFYEAALWAAQFGSWERKVFSTLFDIPRWAGLLFLLALLGLLVSIEGARVSYANGAILGSVFITGLTSICLEIVALLAFQIVYGYIYQKIGLLLAAFMLGLSLGASWGRRLEPSRRWLWGLQAALTALCLFLFLILQGPWGTPSPYPWLEGAFFLLLLGVGILAGAQFCLANALFLRIRGQAAWGTAYAVDLWGSALGALCFSAFLIPRWGIAWALLLLTVLNAASVLLISLFPARPAAAAHR